MNHKKKHNQRLKKQRGGGNEIGPATQSDATVNNVPSTGSGGDGCPGPACAQKKQGNLDNTFGSVFNFFTLVGPYVLIGFFVLLSFFNKNLKGFIIFLVFWF